MAIAQPPPAAPRKRPAEPEIVLRPEVVKPEVVLQPRIDLHPEPPPGTPLEVLTSQEPEPETFADRLANLAESLHGERVPYAPGRIVPGTVATLHEVEQAPIVLDVTPSRALLGPAPNVRLLPEPQPPSVAEGIPAEQVFRPRPAAQPARPRAPLAAEPSTPGALLMPDRRSRGPAPAFAPFQDYREAAGRQMRAVTYPAKIASTIAFAADPRVTLPGPALPRELMSLQAAGLVPIRSGRASSGLSAYGWVTKAVVVGMLLTVGLAAAYRVMPGGSTAPPAKPAPEPVVEQPPAPRDDHSLARFVEVTGIRFMEVNRKPQIHYLVVNHSSAPLKSVMIYVTLRTSAAKPGQAPLARLSFRAPDLAANEAKEMFSSIERISSPLDLPDWRDLRADVEVQ